jgi:hypothetical protein
MNAVRRYFLQKIGNDGFRISIRTRERRKQRASLTNTGADGTRAEQSSTGMILCLPTAPLLPIGGSGDFGTSPFYGQLSDKPLLALCTLPGVPEVKEQ